MPQSHTETRNGNTATVWPSPFSAAQWCIIVTKGGNMLTDTVSASDQTDAVNLAFEKGIEQGIGE